MNSGCALLKGNTKDFLTNHILGQTTVYLSDKNGTIVDSVSTDEEGNFEMSLSLEMTKIEIGKTDLNDIIEINPIYFDLNKHDIRPDAAIELDKIVKPP